VLRTCPTAHPLLHQPARIFINLKDLVFKKSFWGSFFFLLCIFLLNEDFYRYSGISLMGSRLIGSFGKLDHFYNYIQGLFWN
jgi:hypothetical protein